ncbi:MAG: hypothetical protein JO024_01125 [Candidatus Eremiobacteraeota bacterium]|nr:hypothetical protein [Candidatus Eremiobacteraeota bacterium]
MTRFRLGINYWPRRSAMYMWQRFDAGEIREDMAAIAALGLDCVRFFLTWEDFQPEAARIDSVALNHLRTIMDAIGDAGLAAIPTLFTGHMSGVNWLPEWTLDAHTPHGRFRTYSRGRELPFGIGDFYREPLIGAQVYHAKTVASSLKGHPALWLWDVGNEFSNLREPQTPADAARWSAALTDALIENSGAGVTGGTHGEDLTRDRHLRPSSLCEPWTFGTMHGYSVYFPESRGRLDHEVVPFLCQLMQSCAGKPVFFSEFGNPTCPSGPNVSAFACLTEDEMCGYAYAVLDRLQQRGALGAMWWCYADYTDELRTLPPFDRAPHELTFGITRADGAQKPIAQTLQQFGKENRHTMPLPASLVDETQYYSGLPAALSQTYREYCEAHDL